MSGEKKTSIPSQHRRYILSIHAASCSRFWRRFCRFHVIGERPSVVNKRFVSTGWTAGFWFRNKTSVNGLAVRSVACSGALGYCSLQGGLPPLPTVEVAREPDQTRSRLSPGVPRPPVTPVWSQIDKVFYSLYIKHIWWGFSGIIPKLTEVQYLWGKIEAQVSKSKCTCKKNSLLLKVYVLKLNKRTKYLYLPLLYFIHQC